MPSDFSLRARRLRAGGLNARQVASRAGHKFLRAATGANATAATLTIGAGNAGVTYTAPLWRGKSGNSFRITHVVSGTATLAVAVSGHDITVTVGSTAGTATSTAAQVAAAVNASVAASDLGIVASLPGTGASVAVAGAATALAGGTGGS